MKFKARIDNTTHREIDVVLELYQKATFKAKTQIKEKEYVVAKRDYCCKQQETDKDHFSLSLDFNIPDHPKICPSLLNCELISIEHQLKATFKVLTGLVENPLYMEFPIVIAQTPTDTCLDLRD